MSEFDLKHISGVQALHQSELGNLDRVIATVEKLGANLSADNRRAYQQVRGSLLRMQKRFEASFDSTLVKSVLASKW